MKNWKKCPTRRQFNKLLKQGRTKSLIRTEHDRTKSFEFRPAGTMWGQPVQGVFRNGKIVGHLIEGTLVLYAKNYNSKKFKEIIQ